LGQPERDEKNGRQNTNLGVGRQYTNQSRRQSHDNDRDQKGVFPANNVANPAKHESAEWSYPKAGSKGC
jgi:hypothetical protein